MKKSLPVLISALCIGLSRLPLHGGWLGFIGLIPLFYYFDSGKKTFRELLRDASIYSAVSLTIYLHWIWGVTYWGLIGIIFFYAIYFFAAFSAVQLVWQRLPKLKYLGFILIFLSAEYLKNFSEFRFPWINIGYALSDYTVLLQAADLGGVTFLSLLLMLSNILLYGIIRKKHSLLFWFAGLMVAWLGYGLWCMETIRLDRADTKISLMQPSIPQDEKWERQYFTELYDRYVNLTVQAAADSAQLLIWPESAMPRYILRETGYLPMIQNLSDTLNLDILVGFPDVLPAPEGYPGGGYYYNSATLFRPFERYAEPYYKILLVPVGERIPALNVFPFLWELQFGQANWEYGDTIRYYESAGAVFSPQICFEISFPELARSMAFRNIGSKEAGKPDKIDFLVNITNDAWFNRSAGPWLHGMLTKFRAIENRIQIYRCANTGISMVVDPLGRIISRTGLFEIRNIRAPLYTSARIPLFYYIYWWNRVICILAALLIILALLHKRIKIFATGGML